MCISLWPVHSCLFIFIIIMWCAYFLFVYLWYFTSHVLVNQIPFTSSLYKDTRISLSPYCQFYDFSHKLSNAVYFHHGSSLSIAMMYTINYHILNLFIQFHWITKTIESILYWVFSRNLNWHESQFLLLHLMCLHEYDLIYLLVFTCYSKQREWKWI